MILTYRRYYVPGEQIVDDLEDALYTAWHMIELNIAAPDELLNDDRSVILNHEQFREKLENWEKENE